MRMTMALSSGGGIALALAIAMGGCSKAKPSDQREVSKARAEAKRLKSVCSSSTAYQHLKGKIFDQAIGQHEGDRANLDILADYSSARMEDPIVEGWDPALDITRCKGRFILEIPQGAERAFAGERRLQADVGYTAQAAADGNGFVYEVHGAEPIVAKLAAFNLTSGAYQPPPAIDDRQTEQDGSAPAAVAQADAPETLPSAVGDQSEPAGRIRSDAPRAGRQTSAPRQSLDPSALEPTRTMPTAASGSGEATVRAFYDALGAGNGASASAMIVSEKRSRGAFSPEAMSRFYGRLPQPIRLTAIVPLASGAYRVSYRYSAGRSHCNGDAVVSLTNRNGRNFIRSIRALNGC